VELKMIEKEGLEYLVGLGIDKEVIVKLEQGTFSKMNLNRVTEPRAAAIKVSTLTGLVDYIKTNVDKLECKLLIQVKSPDEVKLYGPAAALFESDGGAWRNKAILSIKEYLQEQLVEVKDIEIIA
jgi:hypothetical protein